LLNTLKLLAVTGMISTSAPLLGEERTRPVI
jgi:hypothetical protein